MVKVINEKFSKYSHLITDEKIAPRLPETTLFSENSFFEFLNKYYQVYVRPCHDFKINILVTSLDHHQYQIESERTNQIISGKQEAYQFIVMNLLAGKKSIIQQGVPRAKMDGNHFDIRMYAAKLSSEWTITEKVSRISGKGFSVTDEVKKIFPALDIIPKVFPDKSSEISLQLEQITILSAEKLEEKYPNFNLVMIDFYLDQLGKPWIHEVRYRFSDGKWDWHQVLRGEKNLYPYLPETYFYHENLLLKYLEVYRSCIIKPNLSQWGRGLALISQLEDHTFEIHSERKKIPINHFDELLKDIYDRFLSKKFYLIQEKIPLPTIKGCPFDIRVMVQRKTVNSDWVVTGRITRTAANGFIVTNVAKALLTLEDALEASTLNIINTDSLIWELDQLCLLVAKQMAKVYPDARMWGLDIGIDKCGKPWFIEANLVPDISIFRYLPDKTMLNRIKEFIRAGKKQSEEN